MILMFSGSTVTLFGKPRASGDDPFAIRRLKYYWT